MPVAKAKVAGYMSEATGDQVGHPRKFGSIDKYYEITCVVTMHAKAALTSSEAEQAALTTLTRIAGEVPYDHTAWPDSGQLDIKRTAVKQIKIKSIPKPKSIKGIETDEDEEIKEDY